MANPEKVTVDKAYSDAILRRADFHTSTQILGRPDPADVTISRVEYDSLLRVSREYELLKSALFQGGITGETLDLLISGASSNDQRKDSAISMNPWTQDFKDQIPAEVSIPTYPNVAAPFRDMPWRTGPPPASFNLAPGSVPLQSSSLQPPQAHLRVPGLQRQVSYGLSSFADEDAFDDVGGFDETNQVNAGFGMPGANERRTLYLTGFAEKTTYRDLVSVIKGGKLLSVNLRSERTATVTFLEGAAEFLAWTKRNDIYLHQKRIEVRWAERQFHLNGHIKSKIANGATRNLVLHSAIEKGLTQTQIRDDMEHIHNLVIIDISFRAGDAYVSCNSIHNALFARTCMMSRSTYKGCKIEFYRDECDVSLPARPYIPKTVIHEPAKKKAAITNRFDMLNMDGTDGSSDAENRTPSDNDSESQTAEITSNVGVSLNFLDTESI